MLESHAVEFFALIASLVSMLISNLVNLFVKKHRFYLFAAYGAMVLSFCFIFSILDKGQIYIASMVLAGLAALSYAFLFGSKIYKILLFLYYLSMLVSISFLVYNAM